MPEVSVKSNVYAYYEVECPVCEWEGTRQQYEADAWGELQVHMRVTHFGLMHQRKYRRTTTWEMVDDTDDTPAPLDPSKDAKRGKPPASEMEKRDT